MANVGWIGLGRLGAPCSAALAAKGNHTVYGYDVRGDDPKSYDWSNLDPVTLVHSISDVVESTDNVVFIAVQTPHAYDYGGETITPREPRDFEYGFLTQVVREVAFAAYDLRKRITVVIVSTVLPGTFNRDIRPLLNTYTTPVYHPFFIAMGTVVNDFVNPEMILFGVDTSGDEEIVRQLYVPFHSAPSPTMSISSAELTKVAYNTFISAKIVFCNTLMQICEATGADVDDVTSAFEHARDRLISTRYLTAGVGDGGACHPRDNVALSALAQRFGTVDFMGFLTRAREDQTRWLAKIVTRWSELTGKSVVMLGKAYKPHVSLTDGSPALLLSHILETEFSTRVIELDPYVNVADEQRLDSMINQQRSACVYVIMTKHDLFGSLRFPNGSVVIDPFGYVGNQSGVTVVTPGRRGHNIPEYEE